MNRPDPITVSELNGYIKNIIDNDERLGMVYIRGEISNFKRHYTGHLYFTLKDQNSLIKCVMFKTYTSNLDFEPKDGMSVVILGSVSVFERDGIYQIYVKGMEVDGIGALYAEYERLKAKLEEEGLFDESHKKSIPLLPSSIGVVTSQTGAVIRDIINVTTRRFPKVNIKLYPAGVQGKTASKSIVKAIQYFNDAENVDVIIVARGGGSLEDLWPFNEELTARAIYESKIPVISAVGHETDFTIADFVADLRAPTPSAAGELAVPELDKLLTQLNEHRRRLSILLGKKVELMRTRYNSLKNSKVLKDPYDRIRKYTLELTNCEKHISNALELKLKDNKIKLIELATKLDALSPLKTLCRGYTLIENNEGAVTSSKRLNSGDLVDIRFHDGNKKATII